MTKGFAREEGTKTKTSMSGTWGASVIVIAAVRLRQHETVHKQQKQTAEAATAGQKQTRRPASKGRQDRLD